jgi:ABC-type Fe3+/spermidine/putrescine transport system ATPase subunit
MFVFGKIDAWRKYFPNQISSRGIQQKISLVRALSTGAKLLLLDEPLSSLDARVRISLRSEVRKIVKQLGITAIHVTHDQEEAMAIADRIVVMKKGSIVEAGSPEELYMRPKNIFAAFFLGKGNFIPAKIISRKYKSSIASTEKMAFESESSFDLGENVVVFFRPENVTFERRGYNDYTGKIIEKRFTGRHVDYVIESNGIKISSRLLRMYDPSIRVNDIVDLHVEKEDIIVYRYPEEGLEAAFKLE